MIRLAGVRVLGAQGLSQPRTVDLAVEGEGFELDASGLVLSPGWVDLHCHLRDPGFLESETLASGAASAAAGGFTHVLAMANTNPVTDRPGRVQNIAVRCADMPVRISLAAALTENLDGQKLTNAAALKAAGATALSDDGRHALDRSTLARGLAAAAASHLPLLVHAQKEALGRDPQAEVAGIEEALLALGDVPGGRLHVQHVSTGRSVQLLRAARASGLPVTAEVTPHHLALSRDQTLADLNVSPPLRAEADRASVLEALIDGVIDAIATDHAPHSMAAKAAGANGYHGFETAAGVILGLGLPWAVIHRALVERPRQVLRLRSEDDWIVIDPTEEWTVDPRRFKSRGRNTPFAGRRLRGRVALTICRGRLVHRTEVTVG